MSTNWTATIADYDVGARNAQVSRLREQVKTLTIEHSKLQSRTSNGRGTDEELRKQFSMWEEMSKLNQQLFDLGAR